MSFDEPPEEFWDFDKEESELITFLQHLKQDLKRIKTDDGKRVAFRYIGDDPSIHNDAHYAMVRSVSDDITRLMIIDAYALSVESARENGCTEKNYKEIGFIDNGYTDFLGYAYADNSSEAPYLTIEEANQKAIEWEYTKPLSLEESKGHAFLSTKTQITAICQSIDNLRLERSCARQKAAFN